MVTYGNPEGSAVGRGRGGGVSGCVPLGQLSLSKPGLGCSAHFCLFLTDAHESVAKLQQMLMLLPALHASSSNDLKPLLAPMRESQRTLAAGAWSHMDTFGHLLNLLSWGGPQQVMPPGLFTVINRSFSTVSAAVF